MHQITTPQLIGIVPRGPIAPDVPTAESIASACEYRRVERARIEAAFVADGASPSALAALRRSFV